MLRILLTAVLLFGLGCPLLKADDREDIKNLVPVAAGMSKDVFMDLATSATAPKASKVDDKSLTLIFLTIKILPDPTAEQLHDLQFTNVGTPKPSALAREFVRPVKGAIAGNVVTAIHLDRITDVTCEVNGQTATGVVSFEVPDLYKGNVKYRAEKDGAKWKIVEFEMPARKVRIVRGKKNRWQSKR